MGRIYNRSDVLKVAAPALVDDLQKDEVDLMILVPA